MPSVSHERRGALVTTIVFCVIALLACAMPVHNDTWWHLRAGRDTLHGEWPFADRYSWTVPGAFFWNHSWLGQVLFYAVFALGGLPLLTLVCAGATLATCWLVWRQCRGDVTERLCLLGVALPVATLTWSVRPQVAIVLLPIVVSLVARNRLASTALVMALWANLHAGFAIAVFVLAAGVGAAILFDRPAFRKRVAIAATGIAATLVTPLGLTNWREIVASIGRSGANQIIEWRAPDFSGPYPIFWATGAVFLGALAWKWRRLDRPYVQISAIAACFALLSASRAMRNIPAFMWLALPPLSAMLFDRRQNDDRAARSGVRIVWPQSVALVATATVAAWLWTHPTVRMDWHPMSPAAAGAVADCAPPMFNTYDDGGVLIWFVPGQPVFVDSRQDPYPVPLVRQAVLVEQQGDYRRVFEQYGIRCAVLPPASPAVGALLRDGWRRRFADDRWVVVEKAAAQPPSGTK